MKRLFTMLILFAVLISTFSFLCFADADSVTSDIELPYLIDAAGLLDEAEYNTINDKIISVSDKHNIDIVILITSALPDGYTAQSYADDSYDYYGYGRGINHDGCLLLIDMNSRQWHITTTGSCISSMNDKALEYVTDSFLSDLKSGNYKSALLSFVESVDYVVTAKENNTTIKGPFKVTYLLIGLAIGLIVATVTTIGLYSQLKSVRKKAQADDYLVNGSFRITLQRDIFSGTHIAKTPKPKNNSGSSTHVGSSGTSHGGSGGSF